MSRWGKLLVQVSLLGILTGGAVLLVGPRRTEDPVPVTAYMTRECECCGKWVDHMRESGFLVTTRYLPGEELADLKDGFGVPVAARSCHVAEVRGYLVEGHVPAEVVRRLLARRPALAGVAVPGMPVGSPGMEIAGQSPRPYEVVGFDAGGELTLVERR